MESYSVEAILTAVDKGFSSTIKGADSALNGLMKRSTEGAKGVSNMTKSFMMGNLAAKAISTGIRMIGSNVGSAVKRFDTLNSAGKVFEHMKFSAEDAKFATDFFAESLDGLPTGLDQAIKGTQSFAGVTKDLRKSARTWDALNKAIIGFGGDAEQVDRVTDQLTKSFAKGEVDGMAFTSMIRGGMGPALQEMAKRMGHSNIDELQEAFKKGTYDANDFMDALIDLAENGSDSLESLTDMAFAQTEGLGTAWMLVGSRITQGITSVLGSIDTFLESLDFPSMTQMLNKFSYGIRSALKNVGFGLEAFGKMLTPHKQALHDFFDLSGVSPAKLMGGFAQASGAILTSRKAIHLLDKGMQQWGETALKVRNTYSDTAISLKEKFQGIGQSIGFLTRDSDGKLKRTENFMAKTMAKMKHSVTSFGSSVKKTFESFGQGTQTVFENLGKAFPKISQGFQTVGTDLKAMMATNKEEYGKFFNGIKEKSKGIFSKIPEEFQIADGTLKGMMATNKEEYSQFFGSIKEKASSAFDTIKEKAGYLGAAFEPIKNGMQTVGQAVFGAGGKITQFGMQAGMTVAKTVGQLAVMGLKTSAIGAVIGASLMAAGWAYQNFGHQIDAVANLAMTQGPMIISGLADSIIAGIPGLIASGVQMLALFAQVFATNSPVMVQKGVEIIQALIQGLNSNMGSILSSAATIVMTLVSSIASAIPQLMVSGMQLILSLIQGIMGALPGILSTGTTAVTNFISGLTATIGTIIAIGGQIIMTLINGLMTNLPQIIAIGTQAIIGFIQGAITIIPQILQIGAQVIMSLISGLMSNLGNLLSAAGRIIGQLIVAFFRLIPKIIRVGAQIIVSLAKGLWENKGEILDGIKNLCSEIINGFMDGLQGFGADIMRAICEPFGKAGEWVLDKMGITKDGVKNETEQIRTNTEQDMTATAEAMEQNILQGTTAVTTGFNQMSADTVASLQQMAAESGVALNGMAADLNTQMQTIQMTLPAGAEMTAQDVVSHFQMLGVEIPPEFAEAFALAANEVAKANSILPPSAQNVAQNTGDAFGQLVDITGAFMGEYHGVVDEGTAAATEAARANTSEVMTFGEFYAALGETGQRYLGEYDAVVDMMTAETANKAFANTSEVMSAAEWFGFFNQAIQGDLTEYGITVDTITKNAAENAVANTEGVQGVADKYKEVSDGITYGMMPLPDQVGAKASEAASNFVTNSEAAQGAAASYQNTKEGINQAMAGLETQVPGQAQAAAVGVVTESQQIEQAKSFYKSLADTSVMEVASMSARIYNSFNTMKSSINQVMSGINTETTSAFSSMSSSVSSTVSQIEAAVSSSGNNLNSNWKSTMTNLQTGTQNTFSTVRNTVTSSMSGINSTMSSGLNRMRSTVTSGFNSIRSTITNAMSSIVNTIRSSMTSAVSAMRSAASQARSAGHNMGMGFYNGLASMAGSIISLAHSIASRAAAAMRSALRVRSPSRVTMKIAEYAGEGVVRGLMSMVGNVEKAAEKLGLAAIPEISDPLMHIDFAKMNQVKKVTNLSEHNFKAQNDKGAQPVFNINLSVGGYEFREFTATITKEQNKTQNLEWDYGGA